MLYAGGILSSLVLGSVVFREKVTPLKVASSLTALTGLLIFAYPFSLAGSALFGVVMGLVSGLFDAICNSIRKYLRHTPREMVLATSFLITITLLSTTLAASPQVAVTSALTLPVSAAVLVHGLLIIATGYLLIYGLKRTDVHIGTIVLASEIFISLVVNYFLLQESPTMQEFIGALVIFSASILIALGSIRSHRKDPQIIGDLG